MSLEERTVNNPALVVAAVESLQGVRRLTGVLYQDHPVNPNIGRLFLTRDLNQWIEFDLNLVIDGEIDGRFGVNWRLDDTLDAVTIWLPGDARLQYYATASFSADVLYGGFSAQLLGGGSGAVNQPGGAGGVPTWLLALAGPIAPPTTQLFPC
jgi:hypothetical protein